MSNFSVLADAIEKINAKLDVLQGRMDAPSPARAAAAGDKETVDPVPQEMPVGFHDQAPGMEELVKRYVRNEISMQAQADDLGTFEEEDDFTEDDYEELPLGQFDVTEYEMEDDSDMPRILDADEVAPCEPESPHVPAITVPVDDAVASRAAPAASPAPAGLPFDPEGTSP